MSKTHTSLKLSQEEARGTERRESREGHSVSHHTNTLFVFGSPWLSSCSCRERERRGREGGSEREEIERERGGVGRERERGGAIDM